MFCCEQYNFMVRAHEAEKLEDDSTGEEENEELNLHSPTTSSPSGSFAAKPCPSKTSMSYEVLI